jgi:hypothetical protein
MMMSGCAGPFGGVEGGCDLARRAAADDGLGDLSDTPNTDIQAAL